MNSSLRWTEAEHMCSDMGGHLTSIKDYKEMNFLHYKLTTDWFTGDTNTYIGTEIAKEIQICIFFTLKQYCFKREHKVVSKKIRFPKISEQAPLKASKLRSL